MAGIAGTIIANAGKIANWDIGIIDANTISNGGGFIKLIGGGSGTARIEVGNGGDDGKKLAGMVSRSTNYTAPIWWAGESYANMANAPYRVSLDGTLVASKAILQGSLTAANGEALLDTSGLAIVSAPSIGAVYDTNSLRFLSAVGGGRIAALAHSINVGTTQTLLSLANTPAANYKSDFMLLSTGNSADATLTAQVSRGAEVAFVRLSATATEGKIEMVADTLAITVPTASFSGAVTFGSQPMISADGKIDGAWFFKSRTSPSALASYLPVWFDGSLLKARLPDGTIKTISWT